MAGSSMSQNLFKRIAKKKKRIARSNNIFRYSCLKISLWKYQGINDSWSNDS